MNADNDRRLQSTSVSARRSRWSLHRVRIATSQRLLSALRSNRLTRRVCLYAERRLNYLHQRREFSSRIKRLVPSDYVDACERPDLNVALLVVDCLRRSRLSSQGYFRKTTPFIDSLGSQFTAISAAPWTYPSVASMLTGLYPHNHRAFLTGKLKDMGVLTSYQRLRDDVLSLPEMLFLLNYTIYCATTISLASAALRGRAIFRTYGPSTTADRMLGDLTKWIAKKKGKRFFAYVHLGDLHTPLNPPQSFRGYFGDVKYLPNIETFDFMTAEQRQTDSQKWKEYKENQELLYDNTLRYVDHAIENFYNSLERTGLADSTVILITGDHGQEFWEHAEVEALCFYDQRGWSGLGHRHCMFNEVLEVPLVIAGPVPPKRANSPVSTVDIVPTVIDLLGIEHKMRFDGRNIFAALDPRRPLLSEACGAGYEKKALIIGRYKLLYSKDDGIEWLFDLEKDPDERHPIVDKEVCRVFTKRLLQLLAEDDRTRARIAGMKLSARS